MQVNNNKEYKIERTFFKNIKDDDIKIYENGKINNDLLPIPGEIIFGLDLDSFNRTMFIYSNDLEINSTDNINSKMSHYVEDSTFDLNEVIDKLGLENIQTIHGRAEDIGHNIDYREQFDLCVSRAVANLSTLSEYCIPFIKKNGMFVSYKSEHSDEETINAKNAIKKLGGKITNTQIIELPNSNMNRSFVCISKENNTPKAYPRKAGVPTKKPLK